MNELSTQQNLVNVLGLQNKWKQKFQENTKKAFEPVFSTIKDASDEVLKTTMATSNENSEALATLYDIHLEITSDRGMLATYLLALLPKSTNLDHTGQFKVVKDPNSKRVKDLLTNKTLPDILFDDSLTFCQTKKTFNRKGIFWV